MNADTSILRGEARVPGGTPAAATIVLGPAGFSLAVGGAAPFEAAYRDLTTIAVDGHAALLQLGDGPGSERWLLERFGMGLGGLVRGLRDGRLRQWLGDGLVEFGDEPAELVEYAVGSSEGVAQLLYHERGVALAPVDERVERWNVRRADIGAVEVRAETGTVRIDRVAAIPAEPIELRGLGQATTRHAAQWSALRDGAAADMTAILAALVPDASFAIRRLASSVLREGRPVDAAALGEAWPVLERAVLVEPTFAASYEALVAAAGGAAASPWLAISPDRPGATDTPRTWFLVGLPGNLVALELVSAGAHATYLFRVAPRAGFVEGAADPVLEAAVREISEALIDARFLREPISLPAARLAEPGHLRYRLALAALPSLATARARFVTRLVHRDDASWRAALDDVIRWHGATRDETAEWPGRGAQESMTDESPAGDADAGPS